MRPLIPKEGPTMPENSPKKTPAASVVSAADMAKMLAVKTAVTIGTIVAVGVVTHVLEKKFGDKS